MAEQRVGSLKVVSVTYEIWDAGGELMERVDLPVNYVHGGKSNLFPQVEQGLEGRLVGDRIEVTLTPEEGFGAPKPELTFTDDINNVPPEYQRIGAEAMFRNDKGETVTMIVTSIGNGKITLDGNHPLAGRTITFKVTVAGVRDAKPAEVASGVAEGSQFLQ